MDRERGRCNGSEVLVPLGWPDEPDGREIAVRLRGFHVENLGPLAGKGTAPSHM